MNFPSPVALHEYSHLGDNYRQRERIKRKKAHRAAKIENTMRASPAGQRDQNIFETIEEAQE